jgi:hypothetical protein
VSSFRRATLTVGAFALLMNTACYSYQRPTTAVMPVGADVRVKLTTEGTQELARFLGPRVVVAEGTLASTRSDGALMLAVDWIELTDGQRQRWNGEGQVAIPREMTTAADVKTLDRKKSVLVSIAIAAALVILAVVALKGGGAHTTGDAGGGTPVTH